jgi:hypothetical protein
METIDFIVKWNYTKITNIKVSPKESRQRQIIGNYETQSREPKALIVPRLSGYQGSEDVLFF